MKLALLSAASVAAALLAGASYAQSSPSDPNASQQSSTQAPSGDTSAPSAPAQGTNASANTNVVVVTNGPIPDTPENRARFTPLSATGRATKPSGN
ncbi:MAG: hypothetical protein V4466_04375 [Pseudomonadota bacterium]